MEKIEWESKDKWKLDENRKYLWHYDDEDIQVMIFTNDEEDDIKCLWMKILVEQDYVSNYFVYSLETIPKHPLDYALEIFDSYKEQKETQE